MPNRNNRKKERPVKTGIVCDCGRNLSDFELLHHETMCFICCRTYQRLLKDAPEGFEPVRVKNISDDRMYLIESLSIRKMVVQFISETEYTFNPIHFLGYIDFSIGYTLSKKSLQWIYQSVEPYKHKSK